jgi:hypothetical protein
MQEALKAPRSKPIKVAATRRRIGCQRLGGR